LVWSGELCCMQSSFKFQEYSLLTLWYAKQFFLLSKILPLSLHPIVWFGVANSVACKVVLCFKNTASKLTSNCLVWSGQLCCMQSSFLFQEYSIKTYIRLFGLEWGNSVACQAVFLFQEYCLWVYIGSFGLEWRTLLHAKQF
jgi:hypothetical protein